MRRSNRKKGALLATSLFAALVASLAAATAGPVPVRFPEGTLRGFLVMYARDGVTLAHGDLNQISKGGVVESRLVFRFHDGSLYDETVVFSQREVFSLHSYRVVQRGPSFPKTLEAELDRKSQRYRVKRRRDKDLPEETITGRVEFPADVYNGMLTILLNNLPEGAAETVQVAVFTPEPMLIKLKLSPAGEDPVWVGSSRKMASRYVLEPQLGILGMLAPLGGKKVPSYRWWILRGEAPTFLAFEGPFYFGGPSWRVELTAPRWPQRQTAATAMR